MPGSLRGFAWRFLFFAGLQWNSSKYVCQSLFFACGSVYCVNAFLLHASNVLVTFAKWQLARVCSGNRHLSLHLTFTRAIASSPDPATWGVSVCVGLVQRMESLKYYCLSTRAKAWDFSDEKIASLRRSLVTGSKYSVVDQAARTYTPTARRRPPSR